MTQWDNAGMKKILRGLDEVANTKEVSFCRFVRSIVYGGVYRLGDIQAVRDQWLLGGERGSLSGHP